MTVKATERAHRASGEGAALDFVDSAEMAATSGMKIVSFRVALTRSRIRRAEDRSIPTDIPEPNFYVGRSPVWNRESLEAWIEARGKSRAAAEERRLAKEAESD